MDDFEPLSRTDEILYFSSYLPHILDILSQIITVYRCHRKLKEQKQRLVRADSLHRVFSAERDAIAAAERKSESTAS